MKHLAAAVICLTVLYAVDSVFFGGWYFAFTNQAIARACMLDW
jgi:hypothetical protein